MEKLTFNVTINASRQQVWKTLWSDETYPQWTAAFCEGSHAVTNWKEGSKVLFLDQQQNGMVSVIAKLSEPEFMSFKHIGEVKQGVEDTESEAVNTWAGAHENYTLSDANGKTELLIELEGDGLPDEFKTFFADTWPAALNLLKQAAEKNPAE
ncbi:SRPBCC domain-containing protein [uncultured Mucilaginibacter sp.]|uniref:SRPBCC family protein n=1 Tax=uncultured Mucilaginibacter sp. TaxID=797541 RepID=UPI0025FD8232|nr:SRPBCC domain-containing protein [uncultured Mucilaginibacter sp.]